MLRHNHSLFYSFILPIIHSESMADRLGIGITAVVLFGALIVTTKLAGLF